MRTLTDSEVIEIIGGKLDHDKWLELRTAFFDDKCPIQSDFTGNLFYEIKENGDTHLKPIGICIPELKDEPTFENGKG